MRGKDALNLFPASVCFSGSGVRRSGHARGGQEALYGLPGEPSRCFRRCFPLPTFWAENSSKCRSCLADEECWLLLQLCDRGLHHIHQQEKEKQLPWQPHWDAGHGWNVQQTGGGVPVRHRWAVLSDLVVVGGGLVPGLTFLTLLPSLPVAEPINTFHGIHQNNDEPIRVSYHRNIHYNSVVNPNKATIGVGLGLPAFKPGVPFTENIPISVRSKCTFWLFCHESAAFRHSFRE